MTYPIVFCQMGVVLSAALACMRLLCGIRTRPADAGMMLMDGGVLVHQRLPVSGNRQARFVRKPRILIRLWW